jgi:hypothetical protein
MKRFVMLAVCLALSVSLGATAQEQQEPAKGTDFGNNLSELPQGEQALAGVKFKIEKGLIQLGSWVLPGKPEKVTGIKVERPVARLHVLHATGNTQLDDVADGTLIGRYIVHYDDETIDSIPILYGVNIREWWFFEDAPTEVTRGKIAWQGKNRSATSKNATIGLYLLTWDNPRPEKKVVGIDFSARPHVGAAPFCVAMTVEGKDGKEITFVNLQPVANQRLDKDFHIGGARAEGADKQPSRIYVDEDYGVKVAAPLNWARWNPRSTEVPGEICRAWSSDGITGIYLFVQKTDKPYPAQQLARAHAVIRALEMGGEIHKKELRKIAGREAMSVVFTAKGTGYAADGKGEVPTTQHSIAIPREKHIVNLWLISPENGFDAANQVFEAMLKTLEVR